MRAPRHTPNEKWGLTGHRWRHPELARSAARLLPPSLSGPLAALLHRGLRQPLILEA
jgi:hypothetical protein